MNSSDTIMNDDSSSHVVKRNTSNNFPCTKSTQNSINNTELQDSSSNISVNSKNIYKCNVGTK